MEFYKVINYYNSISKGYSELYHNEQKEKIDLLFFYFPDYFKKYFKNKKNKDNINNINIVDLGSGDGVFNFYVKSLINKVNNENKKNLKTQIKINLISYDISFELLKINKNKNKINGIAEYLCFKNKSIDIIFSFTVFQDLLNYKKAINEVYRVLKKEGLFIISILKISNKLKNIEIILLNKFTLIKKLDSKKDIIYILKK